MKFNVKLDYKNDNLNYYKWGTAKQDSIEAEVIIVPGKFLDKALKQTTKLPCIGVAISRKHPDNLFKNTELQDKNIIMIRDQIFKLANKKEVKTLIEHEFGHIFYDHIGATYTIYDEMEVLADAFVEEPKYIKSLEKKWTLFNHKNCKKCGTKTRVDEESIPGHFFIWCPKCGNWIGDGFLNMFYVEKLICNRIGKKIRKIPDNLKYLENKPVLSYEEDKYFENIIAYQREMGLV